MRTYNPPFGTNAEVIPTPGRLSGWQVRLSMAVPCPPHLHEGDCCFDCDSSRAPDGPYDKLRSNIAIADEHLEYVEEPENDGEGVENVPPTAAPAVSGE